MKRVSAAAAAIALLMSSGIAYAQDSSSNTQGRDTDPGNYLKGQKPRISTQTSLGPLFVRRPSSSRLGTR
jgi:hypothetical protein